jgi:hypothetical protein
VVRWAFFAEGDAVLGLGRNAGGRA